MSTPQIVERSYNTQLATPLNRLGTDPANIDCPHCDRRTLTRVENTRSKSTIWAMIGCCLLISPFAVFCVWHSCQNADHFCTVCGEKVAYKHHGDDATPVLPPGMELSERDPVEESVLKRAIRQDPLEDPTEQSPQNLREPAPIPFEDRVSRPKDLTQTLPEQVPMSLEDKISLSRPIR